MAHVLRQSTEIDIRVGPFVDATDGVTPEAGITLASADQAEALKANGAGTTDISSGITMVAVTGCDGWYDLTLTTGLTDTVGELVIVIQDSSVCLPVFVRCQVVEEAVYDAIYAAAAAPITAADINAEVLDVLNTDTFAELAAVPAATSTLADKLNWLFILARNKMTQTTTTSTLRNDADGADVATSTVSDNGTTATRGEWT